MVCVFLQTGDVTTLAVMSEVNTVKPGIMVTIMLLVGHHLSSTSRLICPVKVYSVCFNLDIQATSLQHPGY